MSYMDKLLREVIITYNYYNKGDKRSYDSWKKYCNKAT